MPESPERNEFIALIERHKGIILTVCRQYCRHPGEHDDLAQEIIYQVWKSFKNFDPRYRFSTWLYRISLNVAIAHYRQMRKLQHWVSLDDQHLHIEMPDDGGDQEAARQFLQQFMQGLNPLDRALMLLYLEERSYQDISDILGISSSNVGTRLSRLRQQLKTEAQKNHKMLNNGK